jgi:hypothetical protein
MYFNSKRGAAELGFWKSLAEQRRERNRKFAEEMECTARAYDVKVTFGLPVGA